MDQLDREVIESLSEPAKRVFGSLDYRSRQRMLKKARAMAKEEKTRNQKKSRHVASVRTAETRFKEIIVEQLD